jgi:hypothetical protein
MQGGVVVTIHDIRFDTGNETLFYRLEIARTRCIEQLFNFVHCPPLIPPGPAPVLTVPRVDNFSTQNKHPILL